MFLLSFLVIFSLLFVLYRRKFSYRDKLLSNIPSPKKTFLFHNSLAFNGLDMEGIFNLYESWHNDLGEIFHLTINVFEPALIHIADPIVAKAVSLHHPDRYNSAPYISLVKWIGSDSFFFTSSDKVKSRIEPFSKIRVPWFSQKVEFKIIT